MWLAFTVLIALLCRASAAVSFLPTQEASSPTARREALRCTLAGAWQPKGDEITSLPGWTAALPSRQYSGYLNFSSKHLHYWC